MIPAILSQRHAQKFSYEGYEYVKDKLSVDNSITFWRCDRRRGCTGRVWTNTVDNSFHSIRKEHSCSKTGDAVRVDVDSVKSAVKRRATTTMETPSQIRTEVFENISLAVQGRLPSTDAVRKIVQRARNNQNAGPANPQTRQEIIIDEDYAQYEFTPGNFERFLLQDSGDQDDQRILLFGREYHATWSNQMDELFIDGTFLLSPPLFSQIFIILARRDRGFVFPVLFALLPNKSARTYARLFEMIHTTWPDLNPNVINCDFETALHQALRNGPFQNARIQGCFFHLVQNMRKHLAQFNLLGRYQTDADFALQARMITSVAFVPPVDVIYALSRLDGPLERGGLIAGNNQ